MKQDIKDLRQFGLRLTIALVVIRFIIMLKYTYTNQCLLYIAFVVFTISLILPKILRPFYKISTTIILVITKVISFVVLGLFFYGVISPVGLFMKISRRDPLYRKFDKNVSTYWVKRENKLSDPKRIERQF